MNKVKLVKATDDKLAHYLDKDNVEMEAKFVITVGTGKDTVRYDKRTMTATELETIRNNKGKLAARKICAIIKNVDKRVKNLLTNPDQMLTKDETEILANFITGTANAATDKLEGVTETDAGLPF